MRKRVFFLPKRPERLWGPQSFLFNRYQGSFLAGKPVGTRCYLHLVPRYRMSRSIIPLIPYPFTSRTAKILHVDFISTWELHCKTTYTTHSIFTPYCLKHFDVFLRSVFLSGNAGWWVVDTCRLLLGSGTDLQEGEWRLILRSCPKHLHLLSNHVS
jgi:hypothetical protein